MAITSNNGYGLIGAGLNDKVALVTGGSRGIGRAACLALAAHGMKVALHYRSQIEAAEEVVAQIQKMGCEAFAVQADLADPAASGELVNEILAHFGRIDVLVNNAGEMTDAPVAEMPDAMWERTLALNLTAAFRCARACLPAMVANGWGRIINVTSQAAFTGSANHAHYAASKSGLGGFSYSLAKEVGPHGVTVNLVAPGRIVTDMLTERMEGREEEWMRQTPLRRFGEADEVGSVIAFLASDAAAYITGATIHVNGGLVMG
jgi:3-oxoacyl-[acyl-carrier protein] reductase